MPHLRVFLIAGSATLGAALTIWVGWLLAGVVGPAAGYALLPVGLTAAALLRWRSR